MSRIWTARKKTTFDPGEVTVGTAARYTIFRAGPDAAPATKQVLRLLTGYTLLLLPLHLLVCYLSAYSPGLAAGVVLVTAAALLAVALAKWLALDDILQKLPLLVVLALIGVGLVFLSSQSLSRTLMGGDFFGGLFILIAVVSVLASLYRPMAATYQTVTMKTPFHDLCVAAGALLASLVLALIAYALPKYLLGFYAFAACGCYTGLVITEYVAWCKANPGVSLERRMRFEALSPRRKEFDVLGAVSGAACCGAGLGLFGVFVENVRWPSDDFVRFVRTIAGEPERAVYVLAVMLWLGIFGLVFGCLRTGYTLGTMKPGSLSLTARCAWQALVVFLTYPNVKHPLVHQLRIRWLRPQAVRAALTCGMLITFATAFYPPGEKSRPATVEEKSAATATIVPSPPTPREIPPGDWELARITRQPPETWLGPEFAQRPPVSSAPAPSQPSRQNGPEALSFVERMIGLVVFPPLFVGLMVLYVGVHVLPTYGGYFEKPDPSSPK